MLIIYFHYFFFEKEGIIHRVCPFWLVYECIVVSGSPDEVEGEWEK